MVSLRKIAEENLEPVRWLKTASKVSPEQDRFVAGNAVSVARGCYSKLAWFRAIYADEIPVGLSCCLMMRKSLNTIFGIS